MSRVTLSRYLIEQTRSNNTPADLRFLIEVVAHGGAEHGADGLVLVGPDHSRICYADLESAGLKVPAPPSSRARS